MSKRAKKWILRSLLATSVVLLLLGTGIALVIGTESGTRWVLGQVARFAPVTLAPERVSGTLLTDLTIPSITYSDADRIIEVRGLLINFDWSRSSLHEVVVERLVIQDVTVQNTAVTPAEPSPLDISIPPLPLAVRADQIVLNTLVVDETEVKDIELRTIAMEEQQLRVASAAASIATVSVELHDLVTTLDNDVPIVASVRWRMSDAPWSGQADVSGSLASLGVQHQLFGEFPAFLHGTVALLRRTQPLFDMVAEFDGWQFQEFTVSDATVHITGTTDDYEVQMSGGISADATLSADVDGTVSGNLREIEQLDLSFDSPLAQARATGRVAWEPQLAIDVLLLTEGLNPSTFVAVPAGAINSEIRILASSIADYSLDIISLSGLWNDQPLNATGRASRQAGSWRCANCLINVGKNRVSVNGAVNGRLLTGAVDINAPTLEDLWPGLSGSLTGDGSIGGTLTIPILTGQVSGSNVVFSDWAVESLSAQSQNSTLDNIDITIEISGLAKANARFGSGSARLSGEPLAVALSAEWALDEFAAHVDGQLAIDEETLSGTIGSAGFTEPYTGTWDATEPLQFFVGPGEIRIENGNWENGEARLAHPKITVVDGLISADVSLTRLPLSALNTLLPQSVRVDGLVSARASVAQSAEGWSGNIDWQQNGSTVLFLPGQEDEFLLDVPVVAATARLQQNSAAVEATVTAEPGLQATVNVAVDDLSPDAPVTARLRLSGNEWNWIPPLIPDIDNIKGSLSSDIVATGKLSSPDLSGEFHWQDGELAIPAMNLPLTEINVSLSGISAGDMTIAGRAVSGSGPISISGRLNDVTSKSRSFSLTLQGEEAVLLNWPDYQLTASPDLLFAGNAAGVKVSGKIDLDRAEIVVRELPEGSVRPSDDVSVEGRDEQARERTRLSGDVEFVLSDNIHIRAFGLDTNVEGQLRFVVPEAREPQAQGELRLVGGVFQAYGQRLEIEQGTMVFTGPLDDPLINVRAVRRIDYAGNNVTAGLHITGRAQQLSSTVYADPAMSEAEALSYLVLGRPLEDATSAEGSNLSNTAYSLGLRQAALITNQIGQTVGLDELKVSGDNQNTTELVAGKQINSRLYARYAYGVFTRLGHLLLRYQLSESFTIEVGAGETQSMDIMYTIERE